MAKAKSNKIEIVSITYKVNGETFTANREKKKASNAKGLVAAAEGRVCTPGETKCENGILFRCFDIGDGQTDWLTGNETC